ncbi:MAG: aminotransferase class V-fold PLP-dependent enzyme [Rickettsiales bacterium]|jgi:cysteine desulfurase/selenocysteine lyase|nr:aminotransferase class V-fold PLP-dependent enzyme [Rickettsiales bacterium]
MKNDFAEISGIYADSAASALKPEVVIAAELDFIRNHYANAGRGICRRAEASDAVVARARAATAEFMGAAGADNIIFTHGASEGLNRVANMLNLSPDDVVIASDLDHHSARLPFMMRARVEPCALDKDFNLDAEWLRARCARGDVRAVVITAMSNVLGMPQDVKKLVVAAQGAFTLVDAAQYAAHSDIDVADWGADAVAFSAHKVYGGTGLGVLYLKNPSALKSDMIGGGSIAWVDGDKWEPAASAARFEAGTLPLVQLAGWPIAMEYAKKNSVHNLTERLRAGLAEIPNVRIISPNGAALTTIYHEKTHALDLGSRLGAKGICCRAGTMCASWIHKKLALPATLRFSLGAWNDDADVDAILEALQ